MDNLPICVRPPKILIYGAFVAGVCLLFTALFLVFCVKEDAPLLLNMMPIIPAIAFFIMGTVGLRSAPIVELHEDGLIIQPHKQKIPWEDVTLLKTAMVGLGNRGKQFSFCVCVSENSTHKAPPKVGLDKVLMDAAGAVYDYHAARILLDMNPEKIVQLAKRLQTSHMSAAQKPQEV